MGIEPTSEAWEASILPLYDARSFPLRVDYTQRNARQYRPARSPFCKRNLARLIELAQVSQARWRAQQIPLPGCFLRTLNRTVLPTRQAEVSE